MRYSQVIPWTKDQDDKLRELHKAGLTFSEITQSLNKLFGIFRKKDGVAARAKRIGLPKRDKKPEEPQKEKMFIPKPRYWLNEWYKNEDSDIGILGLTEYTCRFPKGDVKITYCGKPKTNDKSYCLECQKIAYREQ